MASQLLYCMTCAVTLCGVDALYLYFEIFMMEQLTIVIFLNGKEFLSGYMNSIQ